MGPRQITGVSSGTKNPIEITFTPWPSSGRIMSLNPTGLPWTPSMRGMLNPHTSASSTPTRCPSAASAHARFTVTLDLPTPPLPDAIATIAVEAGNEIFDWRLRRRRATAPQLLDERLALLRRHGGQVHRHPLDALERLHGRGHVVA